MPVSYPDAMNCLFNPRMRHVCKKRAAELLNIGAVTGRNTYEQFLSTVFSLGIGLFGA